jgi:hypothetical protein
MESSLDTFNVQGFSAGYRFSAECSAEPLEDIRSYPDVAPFTGVLFG